MPMSEEELALRVLDELYLLSDPYAIEVIQDEHEESKDDDDDFGFEPFVDESDDDIFQLEEWASPHHDDVSFSSPLNFGREPGDLRGPDLAERDRERRRKREKERAKRRRTVDKYRSAKMKKRFDRDVENLSEKYRREGRKLNMNKIVSTVKCRLRAKVDVKKGRFTVAECRTRETRCNFIVEFSFSDRGLRVGMECTGRD